MSSLVLTLTLAAWGVTTSTITTEAFGSSAPKMFGMNMGSDPMTDSLKGLRGKDFEVKFMQYMIVHHQSAIAMAKLVPTHTQRAELITLSHHMIAEQSTEITTMTTWLAQWYQEKPLTDPMSVPGMRKMMGEMDKLKNAKDADFDTQFLTMMTAHHQQADAMANLIPSKTRRPALIQLGQNIIKTQSAEIKHMQGWQQQWFRRSTKDERVP